MDFACSSSRGPHNGPSKAPLEKEERQDMSAFKKHPTRNLILLAFAGVMFIALLVTFISDGRELARVFNQLKLSSIFLAILCMGAAYVALGLSFSAIFKMAHHRVPFPRLLSITFISATFNYIISSGGMSTMAVRSFLLKHEKVPYSVSIPLSFAQNMIFNLVLSVVCLGGVLYLHHHRELTSEGFQVVVILCLLGLIGVVASMMLVFFNKRFRDWFMKRIFSVMGWFTRQVLKKPSHPEKLREIREEVEVSIRYLHQGWARLFLVLLWVTLDWTFTALTLYFCFQAAGVELPSGLLLVAFAVEFLTSTINVVPAGLGVSEGSLSWVLKTFGYDFNQVLVAALLFRVIFFLLPLAIATGLYLDTMRTLWRSQVEHKKTAPSDLPPDLS